MNAKRQLESSIHTMQADVDGMLIAAKNAEEKSKKAARLADELCAEQDHATSLVNTILISLRHKILHLLF